MMLNKESISAVDQSKFGEHFTKPLYEAYNFSRIPGTIVEALTSEGARSLPKDTLPEKRTYQKAVFLFVDAFGWKFYEENKDRYPSLQRFVNHGVVSKITSQFPSTTPVHVTTTNTGLNVGEHGVYEWFYYEPKIDAVMAPLLFSFAGDEGRDTLSAAGIEAKDLYPNKTIYQKLSGLGVRSYVFPSSEFAASPYNRIMENGATQSIPYGTLSEAFTLLSQKLLSEKEKAYFFLYYPKIDTMGHKYGPDSPEFRAEIDTYFTALERIFFAVLEGRLKNTVVFLSADHGQTRLYPEKGYYVNKLIPEISGYFLRTKEGNPIVPAGSSRDMFLHVKEEKVDELKGKIEEKIRGIGEVYKTSELIDKGFFGSRHPSNEFMSRVGNLVILPYSGQAIWWYKKGVFENKHKGHHGGLSKEEMEVPFLALSF